MTMRLIAAFAATFAAVTALLASFAAAELKGAYIGVDEAQGMKLEFSGGGKISGTLTDASGARIPFKADTLTTGGETIVKQGGRDVYMLFIDEPLGISVVTIPLTAKRELITKETAGLAFVREGVTPPPKPARYVPPPSGPGGTIDPRAFVDSYAFWPPANVANGYEMVRGRYRTLIRLHPLVQADILWRMCRSRTSPAVLAEALRGQGAGCDDVLAAFTRMLSGGAAVETFNRFQRDVVAQREALMEAIRCSIDYRRNDPACRRAGTRVAEAAVSLQTVASVLSRY